MRSDLQASLLDGGSFSLMVGLGETYLAAFVLTLGLGQVTAGLVATLPLLAGALLQMASPAVVRRLGSYKRWVVLCAICQGASFLPLVALALVDGLPGWLVFVVAAVYWGAGMATGPAWNTWIGTLVPVTMRARFFAWRTRFSQMGVVLGFVIGALLLQGGTLAGFPVEVFALLFALAAACRFCSAWQLSKHSEPVPPSNHHRRVTVWQFIGRLGRGRDGGVLLYMLAIQSAVQVASPYFTPFMLRQLHLSYLEYMVLVVAAYGAKIIALPAIGSLAKRCGAWHTLWWGSLGIMPLSALWLVSNSFFYLLLLQMAGGVAWAAYELAIFLILFEAIPEEERTSVLTCYNLAHALATVGGSLLGGALLIGFGATPGTYLTIFALSSAARLVAIALLLRPAREPAQTQAMVGLRTLAIRPNAGLDERPILADVNDEIAPEAAPA